MTIQYTLLFLKYVELTINVAVYLLFQCLCSVLRKIAVNLFNMRQHVAFLVESYPATGNWTNVGLIVGMYALMREKFAHAFEDLHACALDIA